MSIIKDRIPEFGYLRNGLIDNPDVVNPADIRDFVCHIGNSLDDGIDVTRAQMYRYKCYQELQPYQPTNVQRGDDVSLPSYRKTYLLTVQSMYRDRLTEVLRVVEEVADVYRHQIVGCLELADCYRSKTQPYSSDDIYAMRYTMLKAHELSRQ